MEKEYAKDIMKILKDIDRSALYSFLEEGEEVVVEVESGKVVLSLLDGDFVVRPLTKTIPYDTEKP
ncbi:MAG: hypothetical protein ACXADO_05070 [Candidatus Thorarchaeota archaeon]|jgi:hypothetical protein